jgi:hypothetical protein
MQGCSTGVLDCAVLLLMRCHAGCGWAMTTKHLKTTAAVHLSASVRSENIHECYVQCESKAAAERCRVASTANDHFVHWIVPWR